MRPAAALPAAAARPLHSPPRAIQRMEIDDEDEDFVIPRQYRPPPRPTLWDWVKQPLQEVEKAQKRRARLYRRQFRRDLRAGKFPVLSNAKWERPPLPPVHPPLSQSNDLPPQEETYQQTDYSQYKKTKGNSKLERLKYKKEKEEETGGEKEKQREPQKISKSRLKSEYPYGSANTLPHVHNYAKGFHLKTSDGRRLNIVQNGTYYKAAATEALEFAQEYSYELYELLQAMIDGYQ